MRLIPPPSSSVSGRASPDLISLVEQITPSSAEATRHALVRASRIRTFVRDEVIVPQGEGSAYGFVIAGVVAARRTSSDGRAVVPLVLGRGGALGPMVLSGREALFDYVGLAAGSAALWSGSQIRSLAATDPGLALDLLDHTLDRLAELATRLDSLHYQDARRRVARVLVEFGDVCFGDHPDVARTAVWMLVGTSREMTRRVLGLLEAEGAIRRVGRTGLELCDADLLRQLAGIMPTHVDRPENSSRLRPIGGWPKGTSVRPGTSSSSSLASGGNVA
jgi:CRP-like cAMP-binding protein